MATTPTSAQLDAPKIISNSQTVACERCTFLNAADAKVCGMCEAELKPPTHEVQANGMWRCGSCSNLNRKGLKECHECHTTFYSTVTSTAPSQIFCSRCGFLNDGDNAQCVQCDNQLRSTLEKFSTDLRDSTNFLARDMGVNINIKCPGCLVVCFVPPATAGLRCGTCHTYFASPTVGEVTNFHISRLATSISSSFRGFFSRDTRSSITEQEPEAPIGRLLAIGDIAQQQQSNSNTQASSSFGSGSAALSDASFSLSGGDDDDDNDDDNGDEQLHKEEEREDEEGKEDAGAFLQETHAGSSFVESSPPTRAAVVETRQQASPRHTHVHDMMDHSPLKPSAAHGGVTFAVATATPHASSGRPHAVPMVLQAAEPQDMIRVEGDIVEL